MKLICPRCKLRPKAEGRHYCRPCLTEYQRRFNVINYNGHGPRARSLDTKESSPILEHTGWAIDRRYSSLSAGNVPDVYFTLTRRTYRDRKESDVRAMGPDTFKVKVPREPWSWRR